MTQHGFYSIVREGRDVYHVRGCVKRDLEDLVHLLWLEEDRRSMAESQLPAPLYREQEASPRSLVTPWQHERQIAGCSV